MSQEPAPAIKLYGTTETVSAVTALHAGPLSVSLDDGALRFIKINGVEAIRNIAFVVRNADWGTFVPVINNLQISQGDDEFTVTYEAVCDDSGVQLHYNVSISGKSDGSLVFGASYRASHDFTTNRTGFVVLHPINGVAGNAVEVEKTDGTVESSVFPELIDPVQPFKDLRALTHEVYAGTAIRCEMTGDAFEMEDHRQWNDASYKTYVRPLAMPWPYVVPAGESFKQAVSLTVASAAHSTTEHRRGGSAHKIVVGRVLNDFRMPRIGLGLEPQHLDSAQQKADLLKTLGIKHLSVWHDLQCHGVQELAGASKLADDCGTTLGLHAVIPDNDFEQEIEALAQQCKAANLNPSCVVVSPATYLKSIMPGPDWPQVTSLNEIYRIAREFFPSAEVGGGMLAFFAELNRHRPPLQHLDYVTHASNTITHASDDITVTENLEALPHIISSCRAFIGDKPYRLGPSSIGMRFNPYGSKVMDNPDNGRVAMARMEPRQRGLINAAWTLGYVAQAASGGVEAVDLHAPTGEFGVIYHPQRWQQPGFDDTGRAVYPVYPVVQGLAAAQSSALCEMTNSNSRDIAALAFEDNQGNRTLWLANLTCEHKLLTVEGDFGKQWSVASVSTGTWNQCTMTADGFDETVRDAIGPDYTLGPYQVSRLTVRQ